MRSEEKTNLEITLDPAGVAELARRLQKGNLLGLRQFYAGKLGAGRADAAITQIICELQDEAAGITLLKNCVEAGNTAIVGAVLGLSEKYQSEYHKILPQAKTVEMAECIYSHVGSARRALDLMQPEDLQGNDIAMRACLGLLTDEWTKTNKWDNAKFYCRNVLEHVIDRGTSSQVEIMLEVFLAKNHPEVAMIRGKQARDRSPWSLALDQGVTGNTENLKTFHKVLGNTEALKAHILDHLRQESNSWLNTAGQPKVSQLSSAIILGSDRQEAVNLTLGLLSHTEVEALLTEQMPKTGEAPLHVAALEGSESMLSMLLEKLSDDKKAEVMARDEFKDFMGKNDNLSNKFKENLAKTSKAKPASAAEARPAAAAEDAQAAKRNVRK